MNRRRALLSIAGVSSLAGCSSSIKGAVRTGPPYFEEVEISGDDEVAVGDSIELEISVKNTGGREGDFTGTLTLGSGPLTTEQSVLIEDVPIGETKSTTIGPFSLPYAGDYTFRITDHNAALSVSATTAQASLGESVTLPELTLLPENPDVVESVIQDTIHGKEIVSPSGVFLTVDVNVSTESDAPRPSAMHYSVGGSDPTDVRLFPRNSRRMPYSEVSQNSTGYLAFEVRRSELNSKSSLKFDDDNDSSPEISWDISELDLPDTKVDSVEIPDSVELDEMFEIKITATNDGSSSGQFNAILDVEETDYSGSEWTPMEWFSEPLEPGETSTVSVSSVRRKLGEERFRLRTKNGAISRSSVSINPAQLSFGETFSFGGRWEVTVISTYPKLVDSVTYGSGYGERVYEAKSGYGVLLVKASRTNTGGGLPHPEVESFAVIDGDERYSASDPTYKSTFSEPIQDREFGYTSQSEGETLTGWVPIPIPETMSPNSVDILCAPSSYSTEVEEAAIWSND